jgi:hypothetical protein
MYSIALTKESYRLIDICEALAYAFMHDGEKTDAVIEHLMVACGYADSYEDVDKFLIIKDKNQMISRDELVSALCDMVAFGTANKGWQGTFIHYLEENPVKSGGGGSDDLDLADIAGGVQIPFDSSQLPAYWNAFGENPFAGEPSDPGKSGKIATAAWK